MPSILVADGDLAIAHTVRRGFQEMEVTVFSTQTGAKAFELFVAYRPDIVLLDMELPDRSGMEVLAEIHQHDAGIPVILMMPHATANMAIEAIARCAFDYVSKPLHLPKMRELVLHAFKTRTSLPAGARRGAAGGRSGRRQLAGG